MIEATDFTTTEMSPTQLAIEREAQRIMVGAAERTVARYVIRKQVSVREQHDLVDMIFGDN